MLKKHVHEILINLILSKVLKRYFVIHKIDTTQYQYETTSHQISSFNSKLVRFKKEPNFKSLKFNNR